MDIDALEPIVRLKNLTKTYGTFSAVDRLNLNIYPGEVYGLLGPNGAGKTTTILMMLGLTEPSAGEAIVCGIDATRNPMAVKRQVGYLPDDVGFYEDRTAADNLVYTARLNRIPLDDALNRAALLLERVGLSEAAGKRVGTFSRGMRQRLGLADVLIKDPRVIILDEPTLGIDPEGVRELLALIRDLSRNEGLTVLLSSHHLHQVQQICDRVGLFVRGKLIASGDINALARQLDGGASYRVELDVHPWNDRLEETLRAVEGVTDVRTKPAASDWTNGPDAGPSFVTAVVSGETDMTAGLVAAAVGEGASLNGVRPLRNDLDDLYHRYFEGGEARERLGE